MIETRSVAVVTGANRGIGLEVVRQLAERGYSVALGSRDPAKGESAAGSIGSDQVFPVQLDVADPASVQASAATVEERFGRTDVLVNNAAILYDTENRAESVDLEIVHRGFSR